MSDYLDPNNEELLKDFFAEATSQVEILEQNILAIEDNPEDHDAIDEIFRAAHTLKGGAATVQMTELAEFTHLVEDLLDEIRSENIKVNEATVDTLLASIDVIKEMLNARMDGGIHDGDISDLKGRLAGLASGKGPAPAPASAKAAAKPSAPVEADTSDALTEYEILELKEASGGEPVFQVNVTFDEDNPMNSVGGIQVYAKLKTLGSVLKTIPEFDKLYEDQFFPVVSYFVSSGKTAAELEKAAFIDDVTNGTSVSLLGEAPEAASVQPKQSVPAEPAPVPEPVKQAPPVQAPQPVAKTPVPEEAPQEEKAKMEEVQKEVSRNQSPAKAKQKDSGGSILRVDSKRIDNLLNLVSEAVINKATFNQISNQFMDIQTELQNTENIFKEKLKNLFDDLPKYLEDIQQDMSVKAIKKEINEKYEDLFNIFDTFENNFKQTVGTFKSTAANLGRNTGDLHEAILRIRMVPINQIFSRFPRLVRDLSKSLNKKIKLTIEGEDTELDKSVIEELLDPLIL